MSRSVFAQRFRGIAGLGPIEYLSGWRPQRARELMRDTNLALAVIAERVGFSSEAAFGRAFKRRFGQSPGIARRRAAAATAEPGRSGSARTGPAGSEQTPSPREDARR